MTTISFNQLNKLVKETLNYLSQNSIDKYHCKCNNYFERTDSANCKDETSAFFPAKKSSHETINRRYSVSSAGSSISSSSVSSSSVCLSSATSSAIPSPKLALTQPPNLISKKNHDSCSSYTSNRHKPSPEYLLHCVNLFQNLFDVDCFLNVPTKLNELYYKFGQLQNFRNVRV